MEKVLFVDDEPNILNAFKRRLSDKYEFITSTSPTEALQLLATSGPVAIVVSDMHMPAMPGTDFLKEVAKKSPDSVRVMLTGLGDQRTAVRAINDGAVFRFLNKPCSVEEFEKILGDCVIQRRLITQERDLLQNTLGGVISLMTDLLSFIDPTAVQHGTRTRRVIKELGKIAQLPMLELELAAMLKGIGKLSLPLELLLKCSQGDTLSSIEQQLIDNSVQTSSRLLRQIPRLERVSALLECVAGITQPKDANHTRAVVALKLAERVSESELDGEDLPQTLSRIAGTLNAAEKQLVQPLLVGLEAKAPIATPEGFLITISELCPGQKLLNDVKDKNGKLLLRKGFSISPAVIERIRNHQDLVGIEGPIRVNERTPTRGS